MKHILPVLFFCASFLVVSPIYASNFEVEIAHETIDVTVGFTGSTIEIFGDRRDEDTLVAIMVEGPKTDVTIWEKARVFGTWVNRYFVHFDNIPKYYSYSLSGTNNSEKTKRLLAFHGIGNDAMLSNARIEKSGSVEDLELFKKELLKKKVDAGLYTKDGVKMNFINNNFFRVRFDIPASAATGNYIIKSYLIKDDEVIEHNTDMLSVEQVGLNAFINESARKHSFIYAFVCIFLAFFSGWLISVLKVRP